MLLFVFMCGFRAAGSGNLTTIGPNATNQTNGTSPPNLCALVTPKCHVCCALPSIEEAGVLVGPGGNSNPECSQVTLRDCVDCCGSPVDSCGQLWGANETCRGCDGGINSGKELDICGICGGSNMVRCADGQCKPSVAQCLPLAVCPGSTPFRCADGSCVALPAACTGRPASGLSASTSPALALGCPLSHQPCACWDGGSCSHGPGSCAVVASCPLDLPLRCDDGSCSSITTPCPSSLPCAPGLRRCADGKCATKDHCPPVNGCSPGGHPLACPDGQCHPLACPDGQCQPWIAPEFGTRHPCTRGCEAGQVRCADGQCASPHVCLPPLWRYKVLPFHIKLDGRTMQSSTSLPIHAVPGAMAVSPPPVIVNAPRVAYGAAQSPPPAPPMPPQPVLQVGSLALPAGALPNGAVLKVAPVSDSDLDEVRLPMGWVSLASSVFSPVVHLTTPDLTNLAPAASAGRMQLSLLAALPQAMLSSKAPPLCLGRAVPLNPVPPDQMSMDQRSRVYSRSLWQCTSAAVTVQYALNMNAGQNAGAKAGGSDTWGSEGTGDTSQESPNAITNSGEVLVTVVAEVVEPGTLVVMLDPRTLQVARYQHPDDAEEDKPQPPGELIQVLVSLMFVGLTVVVGSTFLGLGIDVLWPAKSLSDAQVHPTGPAQ